jgi:hypothetical protein
MKNPKRIIAHGPSFQGYTHFTGILAYITVYTYKLNTGISTSNFTHKKAYLLLERPENSSLKEYFLSGILKFQEIKHSYPFGVFHTSLGPNLCTKSEIKSDLSVESVSSLASQC